MNNKKIDCKIDRIFVCPPNLSASLIAFIIFLFSSTYIKKLVNCILYFLDAKFNGINFTLTITNRDLVAFNFLIKSLLLICFQTYLNGFLFISFQSFYRGIYLLISVGCILKVQLINYSMCVCVCVCVCVYIYIYLFIQFQYCRLQNIVTT